ncbi:MAG TPA: galactose-1-phosphate uridylyltransferase [Candidatus Limnocylindria bacterium]|nr:galactose-1-phosphate uridylyltransferase [Candidatus Limnocylindria bacterium]
MSELRWNPLLGEWVITATHRQDRTFLPPRDYCPLCPTRPGGVPTEIGREDFEIVSFENRFPSLRREPPVPAVDGTELTPVRPAAGVCEVVVYTPEHDATLAGASLARIERLIAVWAHRTVELGARAEVAYVFVFENKGEVIGVTLHHPHGQIYAYPFVPPVIGREAKAGDDHAARTGACLWCDLAEQERGDRRRVLLESGAWLATVPFAARWPYEVHLQPRRHVGWLHELDAAERRDLARVLRRTLRTYDALFGFSLPYIMSIHQRPTDGPGRDAYHLHLEFYPPHRTESKLKYLAGSEAGAGAFINDTLPEETAARLRGVMPLDDGPDA